MGVIDRAHLLKEFEGLENKDLTAITGSKKEYWKNTLQRKQRLYQDEVEKLGAAFPKYNIWICSGIDLANKEHMSPISRKEVDV